MQRIVWIDNLRGILILLVVLGHSIQYGLSDWEQNHVFNFIYSFHMPLFICVSGFVSVKMKTSWKSIQKRFVQLILPFISMSIVSSIYEEKNMVLAWILNPSIGLWFLWCLFFIICIHILVLLISSKYSWLKEGQLALFTAFMLIASMHYFTLLGYPTICKYYLFFIIGFYIHKYYPRIKPLLSMIMWPALFVFIFLAYNFRLTSVSPLFQNFDNALIRQLYSILAALAAIICVFPLSEQFVTKDIPFLTRLGRAKTLGIYVFHQFIMKLWPCSYFLNYADGNHIYVFASWVIAFSFSYFLIMLVERNRILAFFFLGKQKVSTVNDTN